jgi:hypothetical protein
MPIKAKVAADKVERTAVRFVGNPEVIRFFAVIRPMQIIGFERVRESEGLLLTQM